ncbi:MAG: hypothetical protein KF758_13185 [Anaerolineales bacterium]|nr:hypothetical protein [Anaerolineales bacterium]MBX3037856.1 hypothetical protein [Anaerolineales bacterium]
MKKYFFIFFVFALVFSACGANPDEPVSDSPDSNPSGTADYLPKPEDGLLTRGEAYIDSTDLLTMESYPLQFMLNLKGNTPTPCHQLRVLVNSPDVENKILVEVYSVSDPSAICVQVLSPFEVNIPLGSFATGKYVLLVNGNQVAEFDA